ncbi:rhomboid-like protein 14, mitochondrial [Salvia hispanica]|uniref:rhomboid-like protein 14, mitochondrial n=1 Tax=Salvia hispanica TaxID=49212 RepID=UPI002009DB15|nr:rhomboid-like protein 14, mitochondrial [Salvia hispanica]
MLSLLWKGIQLESAMGSVEFASMNLTPALLGMSTLLLAKFLLLLHYDRPYYNEYAVGFSGVLFAMKVVLYSQSDSYTYVHGLIVPARYAAWAELVLIQMLVPGVSFLGHLGGILAGITYVYLKGARSGVNPCVKIMRGVTHLLGWPLRFLNSMCLRPSSGRVFRRGTLQGGETPGVWSCGACTYPSLSSVCEMCGTESNGDGFAPTPTSESISLEELRQRRVQRFGRW